MICFSELSSRLNTSNGQVDDGKVLTNERLQARPHLSVLALVSFVGAFVVARSFTTLHPDIHLIRSGFHIHHFWYGLFMLAVGGWLGISYDHERISRAAAIIFGAGGGLVGDEVGLLLTFGDYWTGITYTLVIIFLAVVTLLIFSIRYSGIIRREFTVLSSSHRALYSGVFLLVVTIGFISETEQAGIKIFLAMLTILGCALIVVYSIRRIRGPHLESPSNDSSDWREKESSDKNCNFA
jgi:hypothetical protein